MSTLCKIRRHKNRKQQRMYWDTPWIYPPCCSFWRVSPSHHHLLQEVELYSLLVDSFRLSRHLAYQPWRSTSITDRYPSWRCVAIRRCWSEFVVAAIYTCTCENSYYKWNSTASSKFVGRSTHNLRAFSSSVQQDEVEVIALISQGYLWKSAVQYFYLAFYASECYFDSQTIFNTIFLVMFTTSLACHATLPVSV